MEKKSYEHPNLEVVVLLPEDILTSSPDDDSNQGEWDKLFKED